MKYIEQFRESDNIMDVYLVKHRQAAVTKNGKPYENVILQDKTGVIDAKIWDPNSAGIEDFDVFDYCMVGGSVTSFNGQLQLSIKRIRKVNEGEYIPADYLPVSSYNIDDMYAELTGFIDSLKSDYLKTLCRAFFVDDKDFIKAFKNSSAAKSVHHGFVGGLLEHTLSVVKLCDFYTKRYKKLNRDLLLSAAMLHDIGKVKELSTFPENDYTDDGQLLGHIVMGCEMVGVKVKDIPGFPGKLEAELKHCILAHHGEYEFGSPKKPALMEAVALNFADNLDAKMETITELFDSTPETGWLGYNRLIDSNIRKTSE
ncbi:MAG: HD domain-containing protein [Lachnospiraceae bacterium]|nr:HD domain-containing protein [Lachnospiraceae bacterium]MBR6487231.1 HD domain-containing protein [Lachnospiraceae bacterium]